MDYLMLFTVIGTIYLPDPYCGTTYRIKTSTQKAVASALVAVPEAVAVVAAVVAGAVG